MKQWIIRDIQEFEKNNIKMVPKIFLDFVNPLWKEQMDKTKSLHYSCASLMNTKTRTVDVQHSKPNRHLPIT